ncbi:DUF805 domain-containing protein [Aminipila terrae]|uniref:DUF805 domain-containing protein n=1 Tax=Aminipila terrae TaxID=2697030 RepID=A0A6P1MHW3_9FIRM|nr:DUF805 domain-containing protein [Aminipila terrae]QHI72194.1 DUF805 domain-containing protein [Aminipila terrae]
MSWYIQAMKKYAVFDGRARRKEYWMFMLFNAILYVLFILLALKLENILPVIIYEVAVIVPSLSVTVRRLHDIDKSGLWVFISFVPFIGDIWMLVLSCLEGTYGENRFGADPKANEGIDIA